MIGASRKVTQDLALLPDSLQIGQTGASVSPRVLLAIGISGAPQHLNYIADRTVIFAFNRDPEAPIMTLNRSRPRPRVFPILGDLFIQVPKFIQAIGAQGVAPAAARSSETATRVL
jgi:electron transfer flavoprotein alpha subunit